MKVKGAKQVHYDAGPNMTPLVDVVMVILIFLMLAGSFAGTTRFIMSKAGVHQKGISSAKVDPNKPIDVVIDVIVSGNSKSADGSGFFAGWQGFGPTNDPEVLTAELN